MKADVPLIELINTGYHFGVDVAPFFSYRGKKVVTLVNGKKENIRRYFDSVKERYQASGLRPYNEAKPDFTAFIYVAQAQEAGKFRRAVEECNKKLQDIGEKEWLDEFGDRLASAIGKELEKQLKP